MKIDRTYLEIKNDIKWNENFILLRKFIMEFDRFPKNKEIYKEVKLGCWCDRQRQGYKGNINYSLSQERIDLLNSIGFIWDANEELWTNTFNLLKEFVEEFGRFPVWNEKYKNINIGNWCVSQRQAYKGQGTSSLSQERVNLL